MKLFILKVALYTLCLPVIIFGIYIIADYLYNNVPPENRLFIWGDSQMLHGIDLNTIKNDDNSLSTMSAARAGASVYDFFVFCEKIPENSNVLVQLSIPAQVRLKETDNNKSALSFSGLRLLHENKYTNQEIVDIALKNRAPKELFTNTISLFPVFDSVKILIPINEYRELWNRPKNYIKEKQTIYIKGIQTLIQKQCKVTFIEFPFHPTLQSIADSAVFHKEINNFRMEVINSFPSVTTDTIQLSKGTEIFHDLTHLNALGAKELTTKLLLKPNKLSYPKYYIVSQE